MAASTNSAEEDAVLSTLPELSKLASGQDVASAFVSSPTANQTTLKEDTMILSAQSAAESSPRPLEAQLRDQELTHCNGVASIPGIPSEIESNLTSEATDISIPPMVHSMTENMLKVSINQPLGSTDDHLPHSSLANDVEHHEMSMVISRNDNCGGDISSKEADVETNSFFGHGHAAIVTIDAPSLQTNNCTVEVDSSNNGMQHSKFANDNDGDGGNDVNDEEEEEDDDSGIDIDDDEEVDDSKSEVEEDSDSSSSTSSLSFLSSSDDDDDDDEVNNLHRLLNGGNNEKDLVMEVESECEEGELKESPSQRKKGSLKQKTRNESSEDEGLKESNWFKNKTKDLPYVPTVSVTLEQYHKTVPVGMISSIVGASVIVEGIAGQQPLNEGSILWLTDQRLPLGIVDELFGPVKKPFYAVRFNDATEMPDGVKEGAQVSYVLEFAEFALNNQDVYSKGYDESGDEDNSDSEVNFSDDEKEAEYKRSKSRVKRGNSETSTLEVDNWQHQEIRAEGKRLNKDNKNWRSRGENTRTFEFHHEFSGRPPRHQNARFQHRRSAKEPTRVDNERDKQWRGNRSPVRQAQSQQPLRAGESKSSTPTSSNSDGSVLTQSQGQHVKINQLQSTSSPIAQEPTLISQICSTSQPIQTNQLRHSTSQQARLNQPQMLTQSASQQVQLLHMNQPHNLMQSTSQQLEMNQPHGLMQSTSPQVVPWQANQLQMPQSQLPGIQHSQIPVYGHAVVAGEGPQWGIGGYGVPLANKLPLQPGTDTVQGLPPGYQSPIYQQQAPSLNQFSSSVPHHFSGQGFQVPPNMGMPVGNQVQAVNANGYPVGVQSAAFAAPVLGIPAGSANTPFNHPTQMVGNQNFVGFTPAFASQTLPSTHGVPEQARTMQPMAAASWQQQPQLQLNSSQDSLGPRPQQPFHPRPHQMRGPYQGRRF